MSDALEVIWAEPGMPGYLDEPHECYTVKYLRADIAEARIAELEAALKPFAEIAGYQGGPIKSARSELFDQASAVLQKGDQ